MKSVTDGSIFRHSSWSELAGNGLSPFSSLRMPDDHQVTTGILLADALGDAKGHYLSGWTETTSRTPPSANYRDYILKIHRLASSGATDLTGPGLYRLASGGQ
jgi:hypothetical protein